MNNQGWIKTHRALLEHDLMTDPVAFTLFSFILMSVDRKTGTLTTGRFQLSNSLRIKPSTVRNVLKRLESKYGVISTNRTTKHTEITVSNWAKYQGETETEDNERTTRGQQKDTIQELRIKNREIKPLDKSNGLSDQQVEVLQKGRDLVIDQLITSFSVARGIPATDKYPRRVAQNIRQKTQSFIKVQGALFFQLRGLELTESYLYERLWPWVKKLDYAEHIEKLETVKLKMQIFFTKVAEQLQKEAHDKNIQPTQVGTPKKEAGGQNKPYSLQPNVSAVKEISSIESLAAGIDTQGLRRILPELSGVGSGTPISVNEGGIPQQGLQGDPVYAWGSKESDQGRKLVN